MAKERIKAGNALLRDQPRLRKVVLEMLYATKCHHALSKALSLGRASAERLLFLVCDIHVRIKRSLRAREGVEEETSDMRVDEQVVKLWRRISS